MNAEQHDMLIRVDTNMDNVLKLLSDLPCKERGETLTAIQVANGKTQTTVKNHQKIVWASVTTAISSYAAIVFLIIKGFIPVAKQ